MINHKRVLAVVPARGGSKGVTLKNLRCVGGVPLVTRVGHIVQKVPCIDRALVSTDHPEIAKAAADGGLEVGFMRSQRLSGDRVSDVPVLQHALEFAEKDEGEQYDIIVLLQPTAPLRKAEHVISTIETLVNSSYDSVWTVSETDSKNHPLKQLKVEDGKD